MEQTAQDQHAAESPLLTLGDLARLCHVPPHAMKYALATYDVQPAQRAGTMRLFSPAQVPHIQSILQRIATRRRRAGGHAAPIERGSL